MMDGSPGNSYKQARRPSAGGEAVDRGTKELPPEQHVGEGVFEWERKIQPDDVDPLDPPSEDRVKARWESHCAFTASERVFTLVAAPFILILMPWNVSSVHVL